MGHPFVWGYMQKAQTGESPVTTLAAARSLRVKTSADMNVRGTQAFVSEELVHLGCALAGSGEAGQAQALQQ